MVRIAVLDKQELFRESFCSWMSSIEGFELVFSHASFHLLQNKVDSDSVDAVIIDIKDITHNDWDILSSIIHNHPKLKLIVISDEIDQDLLKKLMELRVKGFFSKRTNSTWILNAITEIIESDFTCDVRLGPYVRERLVNGLLQSRQRNDFPIVQFSGRELQILNMVCLEKTNNEISSELKLSVRTVETHRRRMIEKTHSRSILGVVLYAYEKKLIQKGPGSS